MAGASHTPTGPPTPPHARAGVLSSVAFFSAPKVAKAGVSAVRSTTSTPVVLVIPGAGDPTPLSSLGFSKIAALATSAACFAAKFSPSCRSDSASSAEASALPWAAKVAW